MDWAVVIQTLREQSRKDSSSARDAELIHKDYNSAMLLKFLAMMGNRFANAFEAGHTATGAVILEEPTIVVKRGKKTVTRKVSKASVTAVARSWAHKTKRKDNGHESPSAD